MIGLSSAEEGRESDLSGSGCGSGWSSGAGAGGDTFGKEDGGEVATCGVCGGMASGDEVRFVVRPFRVVPGTLGDRFGGSRVDGLGGALES